MAFRIAQKTLETLEWPPVVAHLREHCRTPQARCFSSAHRGVEPQSDDGAHSDTSSASAPLAVGAAESDPEGDRTRQLARRDVVVLACSVLRDLIAPRLTEADVSVTYLDTGLHLFPGRMAAALAAELDALPSPSTVLLGYGLCGKGLENLESGAHTLIIPRTDDCIAILLGSQDAYLRAQTERPGTYYLSRGWLESGSDPLDQYRAFVDQYGRESADYLVDTMYANYRALCLVASTREELEECRPLAREVVDFCRERWGMEYEECVGSGELVRRLIEAPGRPEGLGEDFVVIPPGGRVEAGMFLRRGDS